MYWVLLASLDLTLQTHPPALYSGDPGLPWFLIRATRPPLPLLRTLVLSIPSAQTDLIPCSFPWLALTSPFSSQPPNHCLQEASPKPFGPSPPSDHTLQFFYFTLLLPVLFWGFFGHTCSMWKFPGQRWNPRHSSDPNHCGDNATSLTCCATGELQSCSSYKGFM